MVVELHARQGTGRAMDELPEWEPGTVAVLSVAGPHAIPVSTAVRLSGDRIAFALGVGRETLARLREDPAAAVSLFAAGLAFSAYGIARVAREKLECAPHVAGLELRVERIQDHLEGARTEILGPVSWRWTEKEAAETDEAIRMELTAL
jgi:hypothetical protein